MSTIVVLPPPATGKEFCRARLILGVSQRQVARRLGIKPDTLARHEMNTLAIETSMAARWRQALATCGQERLHDAARHGFTAHDFADTELSAMVAALKHG